MTSKWRGYGEQTKFGQWCREHPDLEAHQQSLTVTDSDWIFQKYKTNVDACGTREVQLMMLVETKSRDAQPSQSQIETLYFSHQLLCTSGHTKRVKRIGRPAVALWHFGVYVLRMPGDRPDEHDYVHWGIFDDSGSLVWSRGSSAALPRILRFELRPDNPSKLLSLRRHHKTREVVSVEEMPLGFSTERRITKRS